MPVVNSPMGRFRFPDDMPMEAIDAEMSALHAPEPPQGNNFASALRNSFFPEQQQAPSVLPVVSAPGLSPQNGDRLRGIVGQQKQLDASEMLRQRATREKAAEDAKQRSQELKLRKQERDNRILEAQMKLDGDMKVIQGEAEAGKIWETNDGSLVRGYQDPQTKQWTTEVLRQGTPKAEKPTRGVLYDNLLLDPTTGEVMVTLPEKGEKPKFVSNYPYPDESGKIAYMDGWLSASTDPEDSGGKFTPVGPTKETGQPRIGAGPDGKYQEIVPGAPVPSRQLSPSDRLKIMEMANERAYELDPDFDKRPREEQDATVRRIEEEMLAKFSGASTSTVATDVPVGPAIGKPGGKFVPYGNGGGFVYKR